MFFAILMIIRDLISNRDNTELDKYIVAGNPKSANDVEVLERDYWNHKQRQSQWFFRA